MLLNIDPLALQKYLEQSEDAEAVGEGEYILDLYETQPPLSLELLIEKKDVSLLAARVMRYDEALDGWYLDEAFKDRAAIEKTLCEELAKT